jgi:hypothetical protein
VPAGDPAADLWLLSGNSLVRVDGIAGTPTSTRDVAVEHCHWKMAFGPMEGAMWLTSSGAPGYVSIIEQASGQGGDPDERFCIARVPIDGGEAEVTLLDLEPKTAMYIGSVASIDGVLWLAASVTPQEGGGIGGSNSGLYRLDPETSSLDKVVPGVLAVAGEGDKLYVVHDANDTGWPRAGVVEPGASEIQNLDFGLKKNDGVWTVGGGAGLVTFGGARYLKKAKGPTPWGATMFSLDPATGAMIESASMKPSDSDFSGHIGASDGIFAINPDVQGLGFLAVADGAKVKRVGERCRQSKQCSMRLAGVTPGAVWALRTQFGQSGVSQHYERYDRGTRSLTVSVPAEAIFATP